jgi:Flp pilus assembly protein TadB
VLLGRTQTSDDVTEQLIDLDIRIGVERATIAQFETLLAAATEFSDIVAVQAVLSEHTVTLEQLLASQRNVDQRVELSTLTIDLTYVTPDSTVADPTPVDDDDSISDAFRTGWDAFAGAAMAVVFVLAVAAPFLALAAVVLGAVWLIVAAASRRRARRNVATRRAAEAAAADSADEVLVGAGRRD